MIRRFGCALELGQKSLMFLLMAPNPEGARRRVMEEETGEQAGRKGRRMALQEIAQKALAIHAGDEWAFRFRDLGEAEMLTEKGWSQPQVRSLEWQ